MVVRTVCVLDAGAERVLQDDSASPPTRWIFLPLPLTLLINPHFMISSHQKAFHSLALILTCILGARELGPFADVLRSIVPIPEAWWQNQMFAVNFLIKSFTLSNHLAIFQNFVQSIYNKFLSVHFGSILLGPLHCSVIDYMK